MTQKTDAIIQALHDIEYDVHFLTSRDPLVDPYAKYVGPKMSTVVYSRHNSSIPGNGFVVIDGLERDEMGLEFTAAHEYVHARDRLSRWPLESVLAWETAGELKYLEDTERLTDFRALLMLPQHASHTNYLRFSRGHDYKFYPTPVEQIEELIAYGRAFGDVNDNLPRIFEELAKELKLYTEEYKQLIDTIRKDYRCAKGAKAFAISLITEVPYIGNKLSERRWREYNERLAKEESDFSVRLYRQIGPRFKVLMGGENPLYGPDLWHHAFLRIKEIEAELIQKGIPLVPPQLRTYV